MQEVRVAIDVSHLGKDHRGMGFFLRNFFSHLSEWMDPSFQILGVSNKKISNENLPFKIVSPKELDPSWLVWFPFNHPTFEPPGSFVVTIHDLAPFVFPVGESKLRKKFRWGARHAKKIVVDSEFIFREVQKYLRVPASRIALIPPGFDASWPKQESFEPPWPYLLAVGPAEPRKNFVQLLYAFYRLKIERHIHKLVILGELPPWRKKMGPFLFEKENPISEVARKIGVGHDVILPGPVSRTILERWYRGASLVVVPSLYEGFGFPVLEAYSCGAPLACSRAASLPEVAGDGAFYFNPRDPKDMAAVLEHALTDEEAVAQKKEYAARQLSLFSPEKCVKGYLALFRSIASES